MAGVSKGVHFSYINKLTVLLSLASVIKNSFFYKYSSFVFNRNQIDIQCTKPTWVKSMKSQAQGIKIAVLFSRTEHNTQLVHRLNITHKNI
jgi:hypothetical protein